MNLIVETQVRWLWQPSRIIQRVVKVSYRVMMVVIADKCREYYLSLYKQVGFNSWVL